MVDDEIYGWDIMFPLIIELIKRENRYPKKNEIYKNRTVGKFYEQLISLNNSGKLEKCHSDALTEIPTPKKYRALEKVSSQNRPSTEDLEWKKDFSAIKKYVKRFALMEDDFPNVYLGRRIKDFFEREFPKFNKNNYCESKRTLLKGIGFPWIVERDEIWKAYLGYTIQFEKQFGRLPSKHNRFKGRKIGEWWWLQNCYYKAERISKKRLFFIKQIIERNDFECRFEKGLQNYIDFQKEPQSPNGGLPSNYKGFNLSTWATTIKSRYKNNGLTVKQLDDLRENDFNFNRIRYTFEEMITLVKQYKKIHKRLPKGNDKILEVNVGVWLCSVKRGLLNPADKKKHRIRLTQERIVLLERLGLKPKGHDKNICRKAA